MARPKSQQASKQASKRSSKRGSEESTRPAARSGGASAKQSAKAKAAARAERAAQARREQEARERKRRFLMIGSVVVAVVLIIGAAWFLASRTGPGDPADAVPAPGSDMGVTIGDGGAPHQVVIYEDFLCPFCGALEASTRDDLQQLADDGQVEVEYRPFVLLSRAGDYSARSLNAFAVVLDTSGEDVAKKFHDLLYENQPEETGPFPSDDELIKLAVKAGADEGDVSDAITSMAQQDFVDQATQDASDLGIQSTPTIYVDGEQFTDGSTVGELSKNLLAAVG